MKKPVIKRLNIPEIRVYLGIIFILTLILLYFDWRVGVPTFVLFVFLIYYNYRATRLRRTEWIRYLENLSEDIDWATKNAVLSIPIPLVITELDGSIIWYNPLFGKLMEGEDLLERYIDEYVPQLNPRQLMEERDGEPKEIEFRGHRYRVTWTDVQIDADIGHPKVIILLYWQDVTDEIRLRTKYHEERIVVANVYVDNYDEVMAGTEESKRPLVLAEIEGRIGKWASGLNASWIKYDRDKFLVVMEAKSMAKVEERKFAILDEIREVNVGNHIPITLSIGVGVDAENPAQSAEFAQSAIDLALGRGGDQAVVKKGSKLFFYGGKTKAVEKRTKVKSRVIANVLRELMEQSWVVYIMSHEFPDLDSLGSALGIYRCARHIGKEAHIILNRSNASVDHLIKELRKKEEYHKLFISVEEARDRLDRQTLLVVVDTHRPSFTEGPDLIQAAEKVVVVDHHRRGTESIENATLAYLEPYASSASELVTEIIQYFDEKVKLDPLEADALLAGITMDTKNFMFKTGVRTFEAASYLRRAGADPTSVKQLFQDDMETFVARAETVKNAKVITPGIAISHCPPGVDNASLIAAQAADGLVTIRGIDASFVLAGVGNDVIISGRSLGNVNVQVILEKLGGGGHMSIAGAQLENMDIEEAEKMVIEAIKEYLKEGEDK